MCETKNIHSSFFPLKMLAFAATFIIHLNKLFFLTDKLHVQWAVWMLSSVMGPLLSICREQHTDLSTSRVMLTIFIGPPQPTTQLNTIQTGHEKPCLTTREGQLILYIPHYYKSSLGPPSQIQGSFHCTRFPHPPKCSPNSSPLTPTLFLRLLPIWSPSHLHLVPIC